uniref:Uncharacterized protein n=1 Tax=Hericium coralloides TaxID=100756 RepID=A0A1P8NNI3_HERCO|nr:hypothetical protein [Hericium coralloides]APX41095.1 hypothetical protein [Hericium coralloides]
MKLLKTNVLLRLVNSYIIYKIINIFKFISIIYYSTLSLPMGYTIKNKLSLFTLLIVSLLSLIFTSNIISILDISDQLKLYIKNILIIFSILNLCYLKFNIIVRLFNLIFKVIPFIIKNRYKIIYIKHIFCFYIILNLFYSFVALMIITKINYILKNHFNIDFYEFINIYCNLIIFFINILYLSKIYYNEIEIINNKPHYILLLIILTFMTIYGLINYSNFYDLNNLLIKRINDLNSYIDKINKITNINIDKINNLYAHMENNTNIHINRNVQQAININNIVYNNITAYLKYNSFWESFELLEDYRLNNWINYSKYKRNIYLLVYKAVSQDFNNSFLLKFLGDLDTFKDNSKNSLIYFNNGYSLWLPEFRVYLGKDIEFYYGSFIKLDDCWTAPQAINLLSKLITNNSDPNINILYDIYFKENNLYFDNYLRTFNGIRIVNITEFLLNQINDTENNNKYRNIYSSLIKNRLYYWPDLKVFILKHKVEIYNSHFNRVHVWECDNKTKLLQILDKTDRLNLLNLLKKYTIYNPKSSLNTLKITELDHNFLSKLIYDFQTVEIRFKADGSLKKILESIKENISYLSIVNKNLKSSDIVGLDSNLTPNKNKYLITKNNHIKYK